MSMDYTGPERRRGGPDRRTPDLKTKILLVDDHALFRVGMRQILEREPDFEIVGEAENSRDAFTLTTETSPDIVLLDLSLPPPGGIETTQRIKREVPSIGIVALAVAEDEDQLFEAIAFAGDAEPGRQIDQNQASQNHSNRNQPVADPEPNAMVFLFFRIKKVHTYKV
jgi:DNA-binding NarL/FixJ family response regulator